MNEIPLDIRQRNSVDMVKEPQHSRDWERESLERGWRKTKVMEIK